MKPTEVKSVQEGIIKYSINLGWKYVPREENDLRRATDGSYKNEILYRDTLNIKLHEFNPWLSANHTISIFTID